jgi:hypothetical protein
VAQELDLSVVFRTVVEALAQTFGYTLVSSYLLEDEVLVLQHQVGYDRVRSSGFRSPRASRDALRVPDGPCCSRTRGKTPPLSAPSKA